MSDLCQYGTPKGSACPSCERDAAFVLVDELRAEIERLRTICACAYQMAGTYGAPVRFLDALALHDEYLRMTPDEINDKLLPVDCPHSNEK